MLGTLQNKHWQVGILPETGGSIAFGRIRYSGTWVDVMRPTDEADYDNASKTASFLMLPWANRIRDGILRYDGQSWQLKTTAEGTARHGDVRKRSWTISEQSETHITLTIKSSDFEDMNFPFAFSAQLTYRLEEEAFIWDVTLRNDDERDFPAGFGFHPYFVRMSPRMPMLEVPCDHYFVLDDTAMPESAPEPILPELDFQQLRHVQDDFSFDHLLANRDTSKPVRLVYEAWNTEIEMSSDSLYKHVILFSAPDGSLAVEPQSNANDGFNLRENGIHDGGVFVVQTGQSVQGAIKLRVLPYSN
ncbi:MAG: hypothetical protein AAF846_29625 [Chloroflexota bacterium]